MICYLCCKRYASIESRNAHGYTKHGGPKSSWAVQPKDWDDRTVVVKATRHSVSPRGATAKPCVNSVAGLIDSPQARRSDGYASLLKAAKPPTESEKIATSLPWLKLPKTSKGCSEVVRHCDETLEVRGIHPDVRDFLISLRGYVEAAGLQLRTREDTSDAQAA